MLQTKSLKTEFSAMIDILFVLAVLTFMSFFYYGLRAVVVVLISVGTSYVADIICLKLRKQRYDYKDLSAVVSGAVLALMMPASVQYNILILANIAAITIGKQIFGGKTKNIFNPAAVGFLIAAFCWKDSVLMYPKPTEALDLTARVGNTLYTSFTQNLQVATTPSVSNFDVLLGKFTGPMGSAHIVILLVCAVVLMFRRSISALTFCAGTGTILAFSYLVPKFGSAPGYSVFYELFSGMMVFGMIFLACDFYTVPKTRSSRFLYGVLIGLFTVAFRHLSSAENAVVFAVLIANPLAISLDRSTLSFSELTNELLQKYRPILKQKLSGVFQTQKAGKSLETQPNSPIKTNERSDNQNAKKARRKRRKN